MSDPKRCPICGIRHPLWVGPRLTGCVDGGTELCQEARAVAYGEAMRRKVCPEGFDETGKIKPGALPMVLEAMGTAGLDAMTGQPLEPDRFAIKSDDARRLAMLNKMEPSDE